MISLILGAAWARAKQSWPMKVIGIVAVGLVAFKGWMMVHDARLVSKTVKATVVKERTQQKENTDVAVKKSVSDQRRAVQPGSSDRLRSKYCADC